ncbi:MAG: hypothetical protein QM817_38540 [Archangium sp.]
MRWESASTARLCYRAASELEASVKALTDAAHTLMQADDAAGRAAAEALESARKRLLDARAALQNEASSRSPLKVTAR